MQLFICNIFHLTFHREIKVIRFFSQWYFVVLRFSFGYCHPVVFTIFLWLLPSSCAYSFLWFISVPLGLNFFLYCDPFVLKLLFCLMPFRFASTLLLVISVPFCLKISYSYCQFVVLNFFFFISIPSCLKFPFCYCHPAVLEFLWLFRHLIA